MSFIGALPSAPKYSYDPHEINATPIVLCNKRQSLKPQSTTYSYFSEAIYKSNRWVGMV